MSLELRSDAIASECDFGHARPQAVSAPEETGCAMPRPALPVNASGAQPTIMSKNQQKKLKRKIEWEEGREDRKVKRRAKAKDKRQSKQEARQERMAQGQQPIAKPRIAQINVPVTIIMDCDFEDLMADGERVSLASQLTRSYSDVRRSVYRPHLAISSFKGALKERFDSVLARNHENWTGVSFSDAGLEQVVEEAKHRMGATKHARIAGPLARGLQKVDVIRDDNENSTLGTDLQTAVQARARAESEGEVIYLSSDSDTILTDLKPYGVYIIGGLVDKNRHKGICQQRALAKNIKTAKLPIGDYLHMRSRQVLTTNQVNEIMVKWLEVGDWGDAFLQAIPKRKGGVLNERVFEGHDDKTVQPAEDRDGSFQSLSSPVLDE